MTQALFLLGAALLFRLAAADPASAGTFTGCVSDLPSSVSSPYTGGTVNTCNSYCRNLNQGYAFAFRAASYNGGPYCVCSASSVSDPTAYQPGTDMACASNYFQQTALTTSFTYDPNSCYSTTDTKTYAEGGTSDTIEHCFSTCANYRTFFWRMEQDPFAGTYQFDCTCSNVVTTSLTGGSTCGYSAGNWYRYTHTAAALGSRAVKREKKRSRSEWCPDGTVACAVKGTEGYECLDTTNELEACGGCTTSLYRASSNTTSAGVDCTRLPGTKPFAMTCDVGQCVASECQAGYMLLGGTCFAV